MAGPEPDVSVAVSTVADAAGPSVVASPAPAEGPPEAVGEPVGSRTESTAVPAAPRGVASLWALFLGLALLMVGNGLNGTVIGVRSGTEGFGVAVTGLIMAGYFAGFLLAPTVVIRLVPDVGHIRAFAGLASTASSAVLLHSLVVTPAAWTVMRFVFGFCAAGLYVVMESWIGEVSDTSNRGRTMGLYMIVSMGGLAVGQLLVSSGDPDGFALFIVASVLVSMSLVPVTLVATSTPPPLRPSNPVGVRELARRVPTGTVGALFNGASVGVLLGMGAVYATAAGLSVHRTGLFLAAPFLGAIVFQWPIGWISDRVPRRGVMLAVSSSAVSLGVALALIPVDRLLVVGLMFLLGGVTFPMYSLVISYTLDWMPVTKTVATAGTLVRVNGVGAVLGPLVAAVLMAGLDERWFFWTLVGTNAAIAVFVASRIASRTALPMHRQRRFVTVPARASMYVMRLTSRR